MKFNCGISYPDRVKAAGEWHSWFAWYPVRLGSHDCRWLETVERKLKTVKQFRYDVIVLGNACWLDWEYRAVQNAD